MFLCRYLIAMPTLKTQAAGIESVNITEQESVFFLSESRIKSIIRLCVLKIFFNVQL